MEVEQPYSTDSINNVDASSSALMDIDSEASALGESGASSYCEEGATIASATIQGTAMPALGMREDSISNNTTPARRASLVLHSEGGFSIVFSKPVACTENSPPNVTTQSTDRTFDDAASICGSEPTHMSSFSPPSKESSEPGKYCPSKRKIYEDKELWEAERTRIREMTEEESQEKESLPSRGLTHGVTLTGRELRAFLHDPSLYPGGMAGNSRDDERRLREGRRRQNYNSRPMSAGNIGDAVWHSKAVVSFANQPMNRNPPNHPWKGTSAPSQTPIGPPVQMSHGPQRNYWDGLSAIPIAILENAFKVAGKAGQLPNKEERQKFAKDMNVTFEARSYWFCKRQGCGITRLGKHSRQSTSPPSQTPIEASDQTTDGPSTSRTFAEIRFSPVQKAMLEYVFLVEGKQPSKENRFSKRSQLEKRDQEQAAKKISDSAAVSNLNSSAYERFKIELEPQHRRPRPSRSLGGFGPGYGNGTSDRKSCRSLSAIALLTSSPRHRDSNFDKYGTKDREVSRRVLQNSGAYRSPMTRPERPHQKAYSKYVPAQCVVLRGEGGTDFIYGGNVSGNLRRPEYKSQPVPPRTRQMGNNDGLCIRIPSRPNAATKRD